MLIKLLMVGDDFMRLIVVFMIIILGVFSLTPNAYSIRVVIEDYSGPSNVIKWTAIPGENYVVHLYGNGGGIDKEVYVFNNSKMEATNVCKLLSDLSSQHNIMVSCDYEFVSVVVFKDSTISKSELLNILSRINSDTEVSIFLVPYKSQEVKGIEKFLYEDGFGMRIWEELHTVFGENKSSGLIGIGNGLFEGGIIAIYAPIFSDEDITLIFKIVRKYIPSDIRFTIMAYHYTPEFNPDIQQIETSSVEHYDPQNVSIPVLILPVAISLVATIPLTVYIWSKYKS